MLPVTKDIPLWRGATPPVTVVLSLKDPATGVATPANLTGATVLLTISWARGLIVKSSAAGALTVDALNGKVTWATSQADTLAIPAGRLATYVYEVITAGGDREPYLTGYIIGCQPGSCPPPDADSAIVIQVVQTGLQGPPGGPGPIGPIGPVGPAQSQSKTTPSRVDLEASHIGVRIPIANQGLSNNVEYGRLEMLPASLLFPGARVNTVTSLSAVRDFVQIDPRDAFPGVVHFANTGLADFTRYDFTIIVPGYSYLVAAGNSPVVLDPGRYDLAWGNGEMVPRNCELFLAPGEAALVGGSVSTRYVYMISAAQGGRFNGRTKSIKDVDGTWTLRGMTQGVAAGASIVIDLASLASGKFAYAPLQVDGSAAMAIGVGTLSAVTAVKVGTVAGTTSTTSDPSGGLEVFNVVSGNAATGVTAQLSIKNNYPSLVGIAWELRNLEAGSQRGYQGPRFVRPKRPLMIGQSLMGHYVQGVAGDAYRKRILAVLG